MLNCIIQRLSEVMLVQVGVLRVAALDLVLVLMETIVRGGGGERRLSMRQRVEYREDPSLSIMRIFLFLLLLPLFHLQRNKNVGKETLEEIPEHPVNVDKSKVNLLA
mmetsp:Transcript_26997/g.88283  ORF Transcript_26997/g.88283 Transcript_26997/m.88283 type:complete len:107 (-) Transcript_26997:1134-1454(-)